MKPLTKVQEAEARGNDIYRTDGPAAVELPGKFLGWQVESRRELFDRR